MSYSPRLPRWAKDWEILLEDVNGTYVRHLDCLRYLFASVIDMDAACGRDNEGHPQFIWEVSLVDILAVPLQEQASAINSCCGFSEFQRIKDEQGMQIALNCLAECLHDYGTKGLLETGSVEGNYFERARAQALRAGNAIVKENRIEELLDKTFNAIGSTCRDAMKGDPIAGLRRSAEEIEAGEREPTQQEQILMKVHSVCRGQTLGGKTPETIALSDLCSAALKKAGIDDGRKDDAGPEAVHPGGEGEEGPLAPRSNGGGGADSPG